MFPLLLLQELVVWFRVCFLSWTCRKWTDK